MAEVRFDESDTLNSIFEECEGTPRKKHSIPVPVFIVSLVAVLVAAVMVTWTVMFGYYNNVLGSYMSQSIPPSIVVDGENVDDFATNVDFLDALFETHYFYEANRDAQFDAALKAFVEASGDRHCEYYTEEEFEALENESAGNSEGIGIHVIDTTVMVGGYDYKAFKIISIVPGGPASESDLEVGDYVFFVEDDNGELVAVDSLGYDPALAKLRGPAGTIARFTVLRDIGNDTYEQILYEVERADFETNSVMWHVCATDPDVGIVKITTFDLTTAKQFADAVDTLVDMGITKIVFDLRYNLGGDLAAVIAMTSRFLDHGDLIISAADKRGNTEYIKAEPVVYDDKYAGCTVTINDIGKYKDLDVAVLCNESSASASEIFISNFRDHGIGKVVGTKTYGKGSIQSIVDLSDYGFEGGLRFTTRVYFPPNGESYDGIGITPDVIVELDEKLYGKNIYDITDAEDNQLQAAIDTLK